MNEANSPSTGQWQETFLSSIHGDTQFFGDPDGARADLDDFIEVAELKQSQFFGRDQERVRVVIGRKGSGKTIYLRKLISDVEDNKAVLLASEDNKVGAIVARAEQSQLLTTHHVVRVAHWFPEVQLTEMWQLAWGRAIILSAATYLVCGKDFATYVSAAERNRIQDDFSFALGDVKDPRSPFTTLKSLIDNAHTGNEFRTILNNALWDDLEARVSTLLWNCPPLYFVLDTIDEDFAHAPAYWARCQKGLFYETYRLLRNSRFGSQLHLLISVRDLVFYSVFRSEHASRYIGDPHIRILDWGPSAARSFLDAKVRRLQRNCWFRSRQPLSLSDWLGFSSVSNGHGEQEDIYHYSLRHTQYIPRDLIFLGNLLGEAMHNCSLLGERLQESQFKTVISTVSRISGLTQIEVVANQVVADEIPIEATGKDFLENYVSNMEYSRDRADRVVDIIRECGFLRIDRAALLALQANGRRTFGAPDLATVLWQAGLLGIDVGGQQRAVFFSFDRMGRLRIPADEENYVFHPSMREVAGLQPKGGPIYW